MKLENIIFQKISSIRFSRKKSFCLTVVADTRDENEILKEEELLYLIGLFSVESSNSYLLLIAIDKK